MSGSLLAFLYPHIKGSQEDVATLSLCHIISQSDALRQQFTRLLSSKLHLDIDEGLSYNTQVVGNQKERPDLVGYSQDRKETIICEVKFFAALTDNQPCGYLSRLEDGKGLIFLCPQSRIVGLWNQLLTRCGTYQSIDDYCVDVMGVHLSIISWTEVLELLSQTAAQKESGMLDDIHQLVGFCHEIENSEFIPFKSEDFGIDVAKRIDRYSMVVDSTTNLLMGKHNLNPSKKGLRATPQRYGYTQYLKAGGFCIGIYYDRNLWKKTSSIITPFWMTLNDENWKQDEVIVHYCSLLPSQLTEKVQGGPVYIALEAPEACTLEETADKMCSQIVYHISGLKRMIENPIRT